jgi:hypothetical protein
MKKFFLLILVVVNINCFAQTNNWFISFSCAPSIGGPAASLKNQMKDQGYGDEEINSFDIFGSGDVQYPKGGAVALLATGGKKISDHKSLYFVAGLAGTATIDGFKSKGYSDGFFGLFAGSYGEHVSMKYNLYQLTAGCMFSFSNSRTQVGFGPSLYVFNYSVSDDYAPGQTHSSIIPGAAINTRIPLGKQRKIVGLEFVTNVNVAPPVKMQSDNPKGFQPKNANMVSVNIGLALSLRK